MKVLVVGAGMYVTGRGTSGPGTVLPALAQASRGRAIDGVTVCSRTPSGAEDVARAAEFCRERLGASLAIEHAISDEVLARGSALSDEFGAAIVVVPDHLHLEIGGRVLDAGLHTLMVKPLAPSLAEAQELERRRSKAGVYGMVEFHKRYDEANLILRRMVQEGELGPVAYAAVEYSQRIDVPLEHFAEWSARTNIFQYLGVHYVDLMYFLTGLSPVRAMGIARRGALAARGVDTPDSVHAMVEWAAPQASSHRFVTQYTIGWIDPSGTSAMSGQRYILVGEKARVEADQKHRGLEFAGVDRRRSINPYFSENLAPPGEPWTFSGYGPRCYDAFLGDVLDLRAGRVTVPALEGRRPTFREALVSSAVLEAVGRSLENGGGWEDVPDPAGS
jgi:predicted dehydrogenase